MTKKQTKVRLLIDGDHLFHKHASACEREHRLCVYMQDDEGNHVPDPAAQTIISLDTVLEAAIESTSGAIKRYIEKLEADEAVLVFSGHANFRKELWDGYKANRKATRKPVGYWDLIAHFRENGPYPVVSEDCLEGDDYIGILATRPSSVTNIIVSGDKDMATLPNVRVYWHDGDPKLCRDFTTTTESAHDYWMLQTLTGDSTDGYKGCPGLGPVGAKEILKSGASWSAIANAYQKGCDAQLKKQRKDDPLADRAKCLDECDVETPEDLALLNARMARILRHTDWDSKIRRPILWDPTT